MKLIEWFKRRFRKPKRAIEPAPGPDTPAPTLREFVYLDEVSLRSLLSSQKGEMTDSTSEESVDALEAEASTTLGANPGLVAKAELASRFQTTNSSTFQTSRKATVQSWFRELHRIPGLRLVEVAKPEKPAADIDALASTTDTSLVVGPNALQRGSLVEFRVKLKADPVFHLGTMVSEFSSMAEDYPDMFAADNGLAAIREVGPINKILQRLLAGLIPIRAEAIDYSVVDIDGVEHVVHNELTVGLDLPSRPLEIVGVTEHLAYWRDIRRVLFSDAEFTLLGRVARDGLARTWTPVKLADLFHDLVPGLVDQINAASSAPFGTPQLVTPLATTETPMGTALRAYADALLAESDKKLSKTKRETVDASISVLEKRSTSVSDQRAAFRQVKDLLGELAKVKVAADRDLEIRESARVSAGLSLFPALSATNAAPAIVRAPTDDKDGSRLLDVEVIAIYW